MLLLVWVRSYTKTAIKVTANIHEVVWKKACFLTVYDCLRWGKKNTKILSFYQRSISDTLSGVLPGF